MTNDEYDVLSYGLNHSIASKHYTNDVLPCMESVWDQLTRNKLLKDNYYNINRAKNCLRALAFNIIDLEDKRIFKDKKKLEIIKNLCQNTVVLKPDKGNGVVVIDSTDCFNSLKTLFADGTKFKKIKDDPTQTIKHHSNLSPKIIEQERNY